MEEQQTILDRLTRLEVSFHERWLAHDTQADERQKITCSKLDEVRKSVDGLRHFCFLRQMDKQRIWGAIILAFLIPLVTTAVIAGGMKERITVNTGRIDRLENWRNERTTDKGI